MAPDSIRTANKQLRDFFARLSPEASGAGTGGVDPADIRVLADLIDRAGQTLADVPGPGLTGSPENPDPDSAAEVTEYAENLRRLKPVLEKLQSDLVQRRDHLQAASARLQRSLAWADSLKLTR